ncbi:MAG: tRNA epoxyqueuosine(34) reductase QueG [Anaerolineaceae bacterium]
MNFKAQLKAEAVRLGFSITGITNTTSPASFSVYKSWCESGLNASMEYLSRENSMQMREHPQLLQNAKNVILVMASYPPINLTTVPTSTGKIANYARIPDYHETIPQRLETLMEWVETNFGSKPGYKIYTDTGPVLERELAQRAGLGWIGKNSCLIHPQFGSFSLIGEIFTDLEIEPDQPFTHDYCGKCQRCITACPTSCILPNRTIDARRCISTLTIENKNEIPIHLREKIGTWVFGCDVCQNVCPWNRKPEKEFIPSNHKLLELPDLKQEILFTPEEFVHKYKSYPVMRAKYRGFKRNLAVAIGNLEDESFYSGLMDYFQIEKDPLIRGHLIWAIHKINPQESHDFLQNLLKTEPDLFVRTEIKSALKMD